MPWRTLLLSVLLCSLALVSLGGILYLMVNLALQPVQLMLALLELALRGDPAA